MTYLEHIDQWLELKILCISARRGVAAREERNQGRNSQVSPHHEIGDSPETLPQIIESKETATPGFLPPETLPTGSGRCSSRRIGLAHRGRRDESSLSLVLTR